MHSVTQKNVQYIWRQGPSVPGKGSVWVLTAGRLRIELLKSDKAFYLTCRGLGIKALKVIARNLPEAQYGAVDIMHTELTNALNALTWIDPALIPVKPKPKTKTRTKIKPDFEPDLSGDFNLE